MKELTISRNSSGLTIFVFDCHIVRFNRPFCNTALSDFALAHLHQYHRPRKGLTDVSLTIFIAGEAMRVRSILSPALSVTNGSWNLRRPDGATGDILPAASGAR